MFKKFLSAILSLSLIFSLAVPAFATEVCATEETVPSISELNLTIEPRSAGLAFGPVTIGNIELKVVNPHIGGVGPYGVVEHINFVITNTTTKEQMANYHIFKGTDLDGIECFVVWDSVTRETVFRHCNSNNWTDAVTQFVDLVVDTLASVLSEANLLAVIGIGAVIIVVLVDLIVPMDPIPILPFAA